MSHNQDRPRVNEKGADRRTRTVARPLIGAMHLQLCLPIIDTSHSMEGQKLKDATSSLLALRNELALPENRDAFDFACVAYATTARCVVPRKLVSEISPNDLELTMSLGVRTNIAAGLNEARTILRGPPTREGKYLRPIIVLLTDGCCNEGGDPVNVATSLKTMADIVAAGFGSDADMDMLRRLATTPDHAIACASGTDLRKFFSTIGKTASVAALTGGSVAALLGPALNPKG